jgi:hypothetical protein
MKPCLTGKLSGWLAVAAFLVIVFFGLRPADLRFTNAVDWITGGGVRIGYYSLAVNKALKGFSDWDPDDGFSIVFAARVLTDPEAGFRSILVLHGGANDRQLIVGQWQSSLVVMNGVNYQYINKKKAIVGQEALVPGELHFFSLTTVSKIGTRLYMDGIEVARREKLKLRIPEDRGRMQLVVGNSVYGNMSWVGELFGLTIYRSRLSPEAVAACYDQWRSTQRFGCSPEHKPMVSYAFNEGSGYRVADQSGSGNELTIPAWPTAPVKRFFSPLWHSLSFRPSMVADIVLNFFGFAPFSFFLFFYLADDSPRKTLHTVLWVVAICFLLSFSIETAQAWMLSRTSSMLDLILNTAGGVVGCWVGRIYRVHWAC